MILVAFVAQNFDIFYSFLRDLAMFQLKCNEHHSGIPKSQIKMLAKISKPNKT